MTTNTYKWTTNDRWLYALSMVPFIILLAGTLYILSGYAPIISVIWVTLYIILNVFQAGCCVGCPYRGKYCPAFVGVYLGNILSVILYRKRQFDPRFFRINAAGGEIMLILFLVFPVYWIFIASWVCLIIYVSLIIGHIFLFMPNQCKKCSYSTTCPGGKAYHTYCKLIRR